MPQDQLGALFREKQQKAKTADIDWAAKRDAWWSAVRALYVKIVHDYLRGAKDAVVITEMDKVVTEKMIGQYSIPELLLRVGEEQVVFSPKGTNIAGAQGRIDVQGERGEATLIWQGDDRWSFVAARVPVVRLVPLTADSLAEVLRGIMLP